MDDGISGGFLIAFIELEGVVGTTELVAGLIEDIGALFAIELGIGLDTPALADAVLLSLLSAAPPGLAIGSFCLKIYSSTKF